jgi:membrane dipeptidase
MIVLDAHQDIAYNALGNIRDYRQSVEYHRNREGAAAKDIATLGLPDALLGRVAIAFATLFVEPAGSPLGKMPGEDLSYKNASEAYSKAMRQMDYYQRLTDEDKRLRLVRTAADLDAVLATWADDKTLADRQQGLVILMEGADPIIEPKQFEEWYERGVRIVGTAWSATRYSGGTGAPGGLSNEGRRLLDNMAGFNAILDLSHMAEQAFLESVDSYEGIVIASHSNPRKFCPTDRHLSDDMIRRLAERDGVMGVVLYNRFLNGEWKAGDRKSDVTLATVADIIDHICQLTGSAAHVGIGSDFDGGFGLMSIPKELDSVMDLLKVGDVLKSRGYSEADIEGVLSGNFLRKLRQCLP